MKSKIIIIFIIGMLGIFCISMSACSQSTKADVQLDENGIEFNLPDRWKSSEGKHFEMYRPLPEENIAGQIIFNYISNETIDKAKQMNAEADKIPEEDKAAIQKAIEELQNLTSEFKELCIIATIDKDIAENQKREELFSKYDNKDLIGEADNFEFYLLYNNKPDSNGLSEKSKKDFEGFYEEIKNLKNLIVSVYTPITETEKISKNKIEFKTKTLDGQEIDSSILKDSKLTMINIWTTFCEPCIAEMPDLQMLYEEVKDQGVNIIGIVSDTPDEEALAKEILIKTGVKYQNIIPDETIKNNILSHISAVPTTIFVDSEGNIIGDLFVGDRGKEVYLNEIENRLESISKSEM